MESGFQMNISEPAVLETVRLIKFIELKHIDFKRNEIKLRHNSNRSALKQH